MSDERHPTQATLSSFVQGRLDEESRRPVRKHLAKCVSCRGTIDETMRVLFDGPTEQAIPLPNVKRAGRYELDEVLGAGSMGVVYAALDPELGRRVAVKLVRAVTEPDRPPSPEESESFRQRFVREGRSLAKVVHPNVVSIYDVGELNGGVFIVMELVEGGTVRDWLDAGPRTFDETLALFLDVGRGLAAVHHAGLIHRDFKPANVLIGKEGRPRVTDFGLARGDFGLDEKQALPDPTTPIVELTQTGALLGTPGYMSLEQLKGERADARSDQFAYAVSLWEAMFGERPFVGNTIGELEQRIATQQLVTPKSTHPANRIEALMPILHRALRADRDQRYPSLDELLTQLETLQPRMATSPAIKVGVGLMVLALAGTAGGLAWRFWGSGRCETSAIDEAWVQRLRPTLITAVGAATSIGGKELASRTLEVLDRYATQIGATRRAVCEATFVRRAQAEGAFAAQNECLRRRQTRLALVIATITTPPSNWQRALDLASSLDSPGECGAVSTTVRSGAGTTERQLLLSDLDAAIHDQRLDRVAELEHKLTSIIERAQRLGEEVIAAEARLVIAQLRFRQGNADGARQLVNDAVAAALTNRATEVALRGYALGTRIFATGVRSVADAERMARLFDDLASSTGTGTALRPRVAAALADAYTHAGRFAEAMAVLEKALGAADATPTARAELGHALGKVLMNQGKSAAAALVLDRALVDAVSAWGPDATQTLAITGERVNVEVQLGGPARALPAQRRLVAQIERIGEDNPRLLVDALNNLGAFLAGADQNEEALTVARRTVAFAESHLPPDHPSRFNPTIGLASQLVDLKQEDEAIQILDKLRPIVDPDDGKPPASSAIFLNLTYASALKTKDPQLALTKLARMRKQAEPFAQRPDVQAMLGEAAELEKQLQKKR